MADYLKKMITKFVDEYASELAAARSSGDYKRPLGNLVRKDLANAFQDRVDSSIYKVKGSVGAGRWTDVPWIAIFDKRITTSAQRGVYIVYLLNKDTKELFLTLNQGATDIVQKGGGESGKLAFQGVALNNNKKTNNFLKANAESIREVIGDNCPLEYGVINTGSEAYDAGCIYYKKYELLSIPDDDELLDDLDHFINAYKTYYEKFIKTKTVEWWPAEVDYTPGFTKEEWIDVLRETIGPVWGNVLAMFYDYGGAATCTQIGEKYGKDPSSISGMCTNLAKAIQRKSGCKTYDSEDGRKRYWPILFQGRNATGDEKGSFVWKLRPALYEALTELDILRFLNTEGGEGKVTLEPKQLVETIKEYIEDKGFSYNDGQIENFFLSLKSKSFVILAGTSGTGKTKLVKLFAEAISAEYKMVAVRPDWSDASDLFGHLDLNGKFIPGTILEFISAAQENKSKPFILCLDEMNLARVEYYLSDFLSIIETRRFEAGEIITDELVSSEKYGADEEARKKYGSIIFPENLYIVGTVNMDETTFPFSKKVLDRANTIEFNYVDLVPEFAETESDTEPLIVDNNFLKTEYLVLVRDCSDEQEYVTQICNRLQNLNEILEKANAHVGYRVRDEIVFYMLNNKKAGYLISDDKAFDKEINQKILPRIQGSSTSIRDMLVELYKYCAGDQSGIDTESGHLGTDMQANAHLARYPESAGKIGYMVARFEEDGFTSYWL